MDESRDAETNEYAGCPGKANVRSMDGMAGTGMRRRLARTAFIGSDVEMSSTRTGTAYNHPTRLKRWRPSG